MRFYGIDHSPFFDDLKKAGNAKTLPARQINKMQEAYECMEKFRNS